jgi:hypothetical protein
MTNPARPRRRRGASPPGRFAPVVAAALVVATAACGSSAHAARRSGDVRITYDGHVDTTNKTPAMHRSSQRG